MNLLFLRQGEITYKQQIKGYHGCYLFKNLAPINDFSKLTLEVQIESTLDASYFI